MTTDTTDPTLTEIRDLLAIAVDHLGELARHPREQRLRAEERERRAEARDSRLNDMVWAKERERDEAAQRRAEEAAAEASRYAALGELHLLEAAGMSLGEITAAKMAIDRGEDWREHRAASRGWSEEHARRVREAEDLVLDGREPWNGADAIPRLEHGQAAEFRRAREAADRAAAKGAA